MSCFVDGKRCCSLCFDTTEEEEEEAAAEMTNPITGQPGSIAEDLAEEKKESKKNKVPLQILGLLFC